MGLTLRDSLNGHLTTSHEAQSESQPDDSTTAPPHRHDIDASIMASPQSSASKATNGSASPAFTTRPSLPGTNVTTDTIEEAYVRFIFYCNPGVPLTADTEPLREAFRNPPRSGGKVFNTFTIYELVKKFYHKEIKTWTELTTTLGVEPPDPSKDESAQKIAQYGVRLKVRVLVRDRSWTSR